MIVIVFPFRWVLANFMWILLIGRPFKSCFFLLKHQFCGDELVLKLHDDSVFDLLSLAWHLSKLEPFLLLIQLVDQFL